MTLKECQRQYKKNRRFQYWLEQLPFDGRRALQAETGVSHYRLAKRSNLKLSELFSVATFADMPETDILNYYKQGDK